MRMVGARVQHYRSIKDTGFFEVEQDKTILVGPNEAGKTVLLQALQRINAPKGVAGFDPLRDYPRSEFNDITTQRVVPADVTVVEAHFKLDKADRDAISEELRRCIYVFGRRLDNSSWHRLDDGPELPAYAEIRNDVVRLCAHIEPRIPSPEDERKQTKNPLAELAAITEGWHDRTRIAGARADALSAWLTKILPYIDETNSREENRHERLVEKTNAAKRRSDALEILHRRLPVFVLFNNYFRVQPLLHLGHLSARIEQKLLDDEQYDYGNQCLLKLLGFTAKELSDLGKAAEPSAGDTAALQKYRDQLDNRSYQLNAASVRLTNEIRAVWLPEGSRAEATRLRVQADAQYLKVVVEESLV